MGMKHEQTNVGSAYLKCVDAITEYAISEFAASVCY